MFVYRFFLYVPLIFVWWGIFVPIVFLPRIKADNGDRHQTIIISTIVKAILIVM